MVSYLELFCEVSWPVLALKIYSPLLKAAKLLRYCGALFGVKRSAVNVLTALRVNKII